MAGLREALVLAVVWSLALVSSAGASTPTLTSVGHENRHATSMFSAPGADDATIYFATKPDRATDGRFLDENIDHLDLLTTDEIQAGRWLDEAQLDPGLYYVLLRASDYDCIGEPNCLSGFSNMLTLTVPKPKARYRASVRTYRNLSTAVLRFKVAPLGERLGYRVCWTRQAKPVSAFAARSRASRGIARPTIRSPSGRAACAGLRGSRGMWAGGRSPRSAPASRDLAASATVARRPHGLR